MVGLEIQGDLRQDLKDGKLSLHDSLNSHIPDEFEVRNFNIGLSGHVFKEIGRSLDKLDMALLAIDLFKDLVGGEELVELSWGNEFGCVELEISDDVKKDFQALELSFQEV